MLPGLFFFFFLRARKPDILKFLGGDKLLQENPTPLETNKKSRITQVTKSASLIAFPTDFVKEN